MAHKRMRNIKDGYKDYYTLKSGARATKIKVHGVIILYGRNQRSHKFQEQEKVPERKIKKGIEI